MRGKKELGSRLKSRESLRGRNKAWKLSILDNLKKLWHLQAHCRKIRSLTWWTRLWKWMECKISLKCLFRCRLNNLLSPLKMWASKIISSLLHFNNLKQDLNSNSWLHPPQSNKSHYSNRSSNFSNLKLCLKYKIIHLQSSNQFCIKCLCKRPQISSHSFSNKQTNRCICKPLHNSSNSNLNKYLSNSASSISLLLDTVMMTNRNNQVSLRLRKPGKQSAARESFSLQSPRKFL